MKKIVVILIICLFAYSSACAGKTEEIEIINITVANIEKNKKKLDMLELKLHIDVSETAPPAAKYYYNEKSDKYELVIFQVDVHHEIFTTRHTYYFENQLAIKYIKERFRHPGSPPKEAVIYNKAEKPLWQNTNAPMITPKDVRQLFKRNMDMFGSISAGY